MTTAAATVATYAATTEIHEPGCKAATRRNATTSDRDLNIADVAEYLAEAKELNSSDYKVHACWRHHLKAVTP